MRARGYPAAGTPYGVTTNENIHGPAYTPALLFARRWCRAPFVGATPRGCPESPLRQGRYGDLPLREAIVAYPFLFSAISEKIPLTLYEDVLISCCIGDNRLFNEAGRFMLEDRLLIVRFNRGDKGVLHRLYEKYKDDLVTLATALLFDKAMAEDVVHDVFVAFCHSAGRFRLTGSLKGYLLTCVANHARNHNKAARRRAHAPLDEAAPMASDSVRPDQAAFFGEQLASLAKGLAQLPYEQRETLLLRSFGQMRFAAIAKAQGVSINTVQGRYRYGMDKLRALLDSEADQ